MLDMNERILMNFWSGDYSSIGQRRLFWRTSGEWGMQWGQPNQTFLERDAILGTILANFWRKNNLKF